MSVARSFWAFCPCRTCARTACARARAPTVTAHKTASLKRFIHFSQTSLVAPENGRVWPCPTLDNFATQLIFEGPGALRGGIQKLHRIFPLAGKAIQSAALQHVLGTFAS